MPSLPLDDENLPLFTVGQVAEMLEIQQAFLRRLDEFGVVRPTRSAGGQRRYTRREITIVQYVGSLVDEGMTLTAIRRVLELENRVRKLENRHRQLETRARELGNRARELEQRLTEVEAHRDALRAALAERDARLAQFTRQPKRS